MHSSQLSTVMCRHNRASNLSWNWRETVRFCSHECRVRRNSFRPGFDAGSMPRAISCRHHSILFFTPLSLLTRLFIVYIHTWILSLEMCRERQFRLNITRMIFFHFWRYSSNWTFLYDKLDILWIYRTFNLPIKISLFVPIMYKYYPNYFIYVGLHSSLTYFVNREAKTPKTPPAAFRYEVVQQSVDFILLR